MEYGIWSGLNPNGVWGDPRIRNPQVLPTSGSQINLRSALALTALQQTLSPFKSLSDGLQQAIQLSKLTANPNECETDASSKNDNENNLENDDDDKPNEINDNEDADEESDCTSSNSSQPSGNNLSKIFDPMSYFNFDKDETIAPLLNSWVLGAYSAMLGRLTAATAASEAIETPSVPSDSESESDKSSYTENSRGNSPVAYQSYPCNSCDVVTASGAALKKHIAECHPASPSASGRSSQGNSGKKRTLTLQRVRYRYEREEYRCTLCSYACTIEKAFQRHLRAHANGTAPETRVSCAVCGADRSSEVDLSRHMRRHRDDRYFCCDICVFRTVQLKKLIQHRRMHTGEKPHLCPHCAYRSARRDNLRSHVRRVHKKENLYCDTFSPRGMLIEQLISSNNSSDDTTGTIQTTPASSPSYLLEIIKVG